MRANRPDAGGSAADVGKGARKPSEGAAEATQSEDDAAAAQETQGAAAAGMRARIEKKSSEEEHRADALAPSAEEGRGKLRKATGSRKQAMNRRSPNGETRRTEGPSR